MARSTSQSRRHERFKAHNRGRVGSSPCLAPVAAVAVVTVSSAAAINWHLDELFSWDLLVNGGCDSVIDSDVTCFSDFLWHID